MLRDRVGLSVFGWGGDKVGHVVHVTNPYPNHKFTRPSSISTLGDFSLSENAS